MLRCLRETSSFRRTAISSETKQKNEGKTNALDRVMRNRISSFHSVFPLALRAVLSVGRFRLLRSTSGLEPSSQFRL